MWETAKIKAAKQNCKCAVVKWCLATSLVFVLCLWKKMTKRNNDELAQTSQQSKVAPLHKQARIFPQMPTKHFSSLLIYERSSDGFASMCRGIEGPCGLSSSSLFHRRWAESFSPLYSLLLNPVLSSDIHFQYSLPFLLHLHTFFFSLLSLFLCLSHDS